jgi:hypothetical protein
VTGAVNDRTHGEPGFSPVAPITQSSRDRSIRGRHAGVFQQPGPIFGRSDSIAAPNRRRIGLI